MQNGSLFLPVVVAIGSILVSCSGSAKLRQQNRSQTAIQDFEKMREDFEPMDLKDDELQFEDDYESLSGTESNWDGNSITRQDSVGSGYRIQLVQTTDPEEAKTVQKDAILRFDKDVYRVFDPPYYKVRLGDFVNWNDAESLQKLAIEKGFPEAWVIRTKVDLRKAYSEIERF